jgi:hypothetical protein
LPHGLFRFGGVLDANGLALLGGGAGTGGTAMEGVSEAGSMVVLSASGPWGLPRGPMEILAVRRVNDPCTRSEMTEIHWGSSSSSPSASPSWPYDKDPTTGAT